MIVTPIRIGQSLPDQRVWRGSVPARPDTLDSFLAATILELFFDEPDAAFAPACRDFKGSTNACWLPMFLTAAS